MTTKQIRPNMSHHFHLIMGPTPTHRVALYILIQVLIRVQSRAIARKIKYLDSIFILLEPFLHLARDMDGMLVNDQKHIPSNLTDQTPQKLLKYLSLKTVFENHEIQSSAIRNGRNHIAPKTFARSRDDGRLPTTPIRTTTGMVRTKTHLISPINLGLSPSGQPPNLRILFLQPLSHLLWILFKCLTGGLLRSKTPSPQIATHCPDRQADPKPLPDQLRHRLTRPQIKGQFQLLRITIHHGPCNLSCLPGLQRSSSASPPPLGSKGSMASFPVLFDPFSNRLTRNAEKFRNFHLLFPISDRPNDLATQILLGNRWERPSILDFHEQMITTLLIKCKLFYALISMSPE